MSATIHPAALRAELANAYGSSEWFRHALVRGFLHTEGVERFAQLAKAYWLIDDCALLLTRIARREGFVHVVLTVHENLTADLVATDGGKNGRRAHRLFSQHIPYTDAPAGAWSFYLERGQVVEGEPAVVMMLPSEH